MSRRIAPPHTAARIRVWAALAWLLMAIVFGTTGWYFAMKPLAAATGNWWTARDYQPVEATVAERKSTDADGTFNWYLARYQVGDKTYQTRRLTVLDNEDIDEQSNEAVLNTLAAAHREGKLVTVWVSPRKPEVALVTRDWPMKSLWSRIPMALGFAIFALAGVMGAIGCVFGFAYYQSMVNAAGLWLFSALWCGFVFPLLTVISISEQTERVPILVVGAFAFIGVLMLYAAVASTLWGVAGVGSEPVDKLAAPLTKRAKKQRGKPEKAHDKPAGDQVKRSGFGGRGDDFDKD
jgi:Protein of unknown function (DUF3592)